MLACRALELSGEVITTPLTSPATVHALTWSGLTPVFADIDPTTLTLDPDAVEQAITPRTTAILGVHVFGRPCRVDAIDSLARRRNLRVVYDGAHAFGTDIDGKTILTFGDATTLSFHATKLFNTAEGGAVVVREPEHKRRVDLLKNLGIKDEVSVDLPGMNARMNELAAALGLANLPRVDGEWQARAAIADIYASRLARIDGVSPLAFPSGVRNSHFYFVVRVRGGRVSRNELYDTLKEYNVFARRYFWPLCNTHPSYRDLPSSRPENLKVATKAAEELLCLPFYGQLGPDAAHRICDIIEQIASGEGRA
jgi:dTDP-4-amino-4,6-dideoxygalactose transaminase